MEVDDSLLEVLNDASVGVVPIRAADVVVVAVESEEDGKVLVAGVVVVVVLVVDIVELVIAGCDEAGLFSLKIISSFNDIILCKFPTP